nr:VanZ family protein [Cellulomonas sp. APG4]
MWSLHRRGRLTVQRGAVALALCVYLAGIVANTVFPIFLDKPVGDAPWSSQLVLVPFADYEVADAVMNVAVFVPLGVLLALILGWSPWWRPVAASAAVSLAIEVLQLLTNHFLGSGHVADVSDLLSNVAGGAVGVALLAGAARTSWGRVAVTAFRWDAPGVETPLPVGR